jgi:hypothetical protein
MWEMWCSWMAYPITQDGPSVGLVLRLFIKLFIFVVAPVMLAISHSSASKQKSPYFEVRDTKHPLDR